MPDELLFTVKGSTATPAEPLTLAQAGLRERKDLQEWVVAHPEILGRDIRIVTMEFDRWQSASGKNSDRLDVLGLHRSGELVVAELKRAAAPDTVEMQAIKYGAMASRFTPEVLAEYHAKYLSDRGTQTDPDAAADLLAAHAELTVESLRRPRLILLAADYPAATVATAVWLREMGIDITLNRYRAYRTGTEISVTVSQLYPVPSVEEFTISPRQAEVKAAEQTRQRRADIGTVARIIQSGNLEDGAPLTLRPYGVNDELRQQIDAWLSASNTRAHAKWQNDEKVPLIWLEDGQPYSPTGLARHVLREATGVDRTLRGGIWWTDDEGHDLVELAAQAAGERAAMYLRFWRQLVETSSELHPDWSTAGNPTEVSWFNFRTDSPNAVWDLSFTYGGRVRSGIYFPDDQASFATLRERGAEIEKSYGAPLQWEDLPNRRASRVADYHPGDVMAAEAHESIIEWLLDSQARLRTALGSPYANV